MTFISGNRPAAGFEQFIRGMFGLAIDGKVSTDSMPKNLLYVALLLQKGDIVLVGVPFVLQALLINSLAQTAEMGGPHDRCTNTGTAQSRAFNNLSIWHHEAASSW